MADFLDGYHEAVRRHWRSVTSIRVNAEAHTVTIRLRDETTFTADISKHPELLDLKLGDEVIVDHYAIPSRG
jgi:hypothetical protein